MSNTLYVVNGGSIQAAIDAASDGDTIIVCAGTYDEAVLVDKSVTLEGFNYGVAGNGVRTIESTITGGVTISADDVVVDGFKITGAPIDDTTRGAVLIKGANDTIKNSIIDGTGIDPNTIGHVTFGIASFPSASSMHITGNKITGYDYGVYEAVSATGTVDHNLFDGNGNGIGADNPTLTITANTFTHSDGAHISGGYFFGSVDLGTLIKSDNTFDSGSEPIRIYLNGGGQVLTGTAYDETFDNTYASGNATVNGGAGNDTLVVDYSGSTAGITMGAPTQDGNGQSGSIQDSSGNHITFTGIENFKILPGSGNDHIATGGGDDYVKTGSGNDVVQTGAGDDTIVGGSGNGDDVYDGGVNTDTVIYSSATHSITVDLRTNDRSGEAVSGADGAGPNPDTIGALLTAAGYPATTPVGKANGIDIGTDALIGIENVVAGSGNDTLTGDGNDNTLTGGLGADTISARGGADTINYSAGDGTDTLLDGGGGSDTLAITGTAASDTIKAVVAGGVITQLSSNADALPGSANVANIETVTLSLNEGGTDTLDYSGTGSGQAIVVDLSTGAATGFTSPVTGVENVTGGSGNDSITGDGNANVLTGGLGIDTVRGRGAADTLNYRAGDGTDTLLDGGANSDTLAITGTAASDTIKVVVAGGVITQLSSNADALPGSANVANIEQVTLSLNEGGTDTLDYSGTGSGQAIVVNLATGAATGFTAPIAGVENIIGGNGNDSLTGDSNNNVLTGGAGDDTLNGGAGTGDKAVFSGAWKDYNVTGSGTGPFTIVDTRPGSPDGTDTVSNVENFQFSDVTVTAAQLPNDAPVAVADTGSATEKGGVNNGSGGADAVGNVLANDTDADSSFGDTKAVSALQGGSDNGATFSRVGAYGTLTITKATGAYTYVVDNGNATVEGLSASSTPLAEVFTYTTKDAHGATSAATLTVSINGADDTAVITVAPVTATESNLPAFTLFNVADRVTITDVDAADAAAPHGYVANSGSIGVPTGPTPPSGSLADYLSFSPQSGFVAYDRSSFNWLSAGQNVVYTISFQAQSGDDAPQPETLTITISGENDAPVLTTLTHPALTTINEHDLGNPGQTVASFRAPISDADSGALSGIAVTGLGIGNGHWEFNTGSGWNSFGAVSDSAALLLRDIDMVRFVPNNASGTSASLDYRAWDQTIGTFGQPANITATGGTTAFSSATDTATITVTPVNDAPAAVNDTSALAGATAATEAGGVLNGTPGANATGNVLANDTDVDNTNASLTVAAVRTGAVEGAGTPGPVSAPLVGAHGTLTLNADGSYVYVVNENDSAVQALNAGTLTDSFNYTVRDPGGLTDTAVLTITINRANDAPVGVDDTSASAGAVVAIEKGGIANGTSGQNASGNVLANDTDVDNVGGLTVTAIRPGGTEGAGAPGSLGVSLAGLHGTLTLGSNGAYTYMVNDNDGAVQALNAGQTITDSFNYTVSDGSLTDTAVLTVTINGANDAPVSADDTSASAGAVVAIEKGGTLNGSGGQNATGNVLANDIDVDNVLTVTAIRAGGTEGSGTAGTVGSGLAGAHGTLTLGSNGSYTYVVNENDSAVQALGTGGTILDNFNYTVSDGTLTDTAVLTVTINGASDAPVAVDDTSTSPGAVVAIEKGGNANGTPGQNASGNVLTNDADVDSGSLTVTAIRAGGTEGAGAPGTLGSGLAGLHGTLTLGSNGAYTYVVDDNDSAVQGLDAGQSITDRFNYTVSDGGLTDTAVLTVTINGANDRATITTSSVTATESDLPSFNFFLVGDKVTIVDVDSNDAAAPNGYVTNSGSVGVPTGPTPPSGTLADLLSFDAATGAVLYDRAAFNWLSNGQSVVYTISFQAQSGDDAPQNKSLMVTINGQNDAPVLTTGTHPVLNGITEHDVANPGQTVASFRGPMSDADFGAAGGIAITGLDNGNSHWEYSIDSGAHWATIAGVSAGTALLLRDTDLVRFVPNDSSGTAASLTYRGWDQTTGTAGGTANTSPNGGTTAFGTATDTATISVAPVNDPPIGLDDTGSALEASGYFNATPGYNATGNVLANDTDDNAHSELVVSAVRRGPEAGSGLAGLIGGELTGQHGTLVMNSDGSFTYTVNENDAVVEALNVGTFTTDTFTYTVRDLGNLTDLAQLVITINGANDAAVITGTSTGAVIEKGGTLNGTPGVATVTASLHATDVDNSPDFVLQTNALKTYGTFSIDASGAWSYTLDDTNSVIQSLNVGDTRHELITVTTVDLTPKQIDITISGANDAPVGVDDTSASAGAVAAVERGGTFNSTGGQNASGNVLINDTDVDNTNASLTVAAFRTGGAEGSGAPGTVGFGLVGAHGTLTLNANGSYTYVVDENDGVVQALNVGQTTTDSFNYTVQDPGGLTDTAVLTITINGANDAPVGVDDNSASAGAVAAIEKGGTFNGTPGQNATGNVIANDTDVDNTNAQLTVTAIRTGGTEGGGTLGSLGVGLVGLHGTLTINSIGAYTYVVNDNDTAVQALNVGNFTTDSFNYTFRDPAGLLDTALLTITINGADDAPVGVDDNSASAGATAAIEKGGTLNGTPGQNATGNVIANDTDVDNTNAQLLVSAIRTGAAEGGGTPGTIGLGLAGLHGTLTIGSSGAYTYVVNENDSVVQALNVGGVVTDSFNYTVSDGTLTDTAVLTITINGANDAPVGVNDTSAGAIAAIEKGGTFNGTGGQNASGNVIANDTDVDNTNAQLSVTAIRLGAAEGGGAPGTLSVGLVGLHGTLTISSTGAYTYVVNETDAAVQALNVSDFITDSFNYTVSDGSLSDTAVLTITINGADDAPVGVDDTSASAGAIAATEKGGNLNGTAGQNASGNVIANDTDVDNTNAQLSVSAIRLGASEGGGSPGTVGVGLVGLHGTLTMGSNGAYTYVVNENDSAVQVLNVGEVITDSFNYTVSDGSLTDTAVLTITIKGANDAPVGVDDTSQTIGATAATEKGGTLNGSAGLDAGGNVLTNDTDVDNTNASLTVAAVRTGASEGGGNPGTVGFGLVGAHGTLTLNANGSYTYVVNENDGAVQALNAGDIITDSFNYTVRDPGGLTDVAVLTITINGANDAPVGVDDTSASAGAVAAVEKGGTFNNTGGQNATGNVLANDTDVDNTNGQLTVTAIRTGGTEAGGTSGSLGVGLVGLHGTLTISSTGAYTYVVNDNDSAVQGLNVGQTTSDSFNYTVQDSGGLTDTAVLTITINGADDAPVGVDDNSASGGATAAIEKSGTLNGTAGQNATGNVLTNDTDVDNTNVQLTVSAIRAGAAEGGGTSGTVGSGLAGLHGTLTIGSNGAYTYVVNENDSAVQALNVGGVTTDSFNYTVSDGSLTDIAVLTITINGANDAPVGVDDTSASAGAVVAIEKGGTFNGSGGQNATGNVIANDTDVDNTNAQLAVTAIRTGAAEGGGTLGSLGVGLVGLHGTLTIGSTGAYTYVVNENDTAVQALNVGGFITDSFNYTVQDPGGLTDTAVLTVTINGADDSPVGVDDTSASTGAVAATEKSGTSNGTPGQNGTGNVITNDTDVDNTNAQLSVTAIRTGASEGGGTPGVVGSGLAGLHGTLTIGSNGAYTYVVNENDSAVQALNVGGVITDSFNYTVSDGSLTDTALLTVTIKGANDAPVGVDDTSAGAIAAIEKGGTLNGTGGQNASGNVITNDTDVDNIGGLSVSAVRTGGTEGSGTSGTVGTGLVGLHGTLTLNAGGSYSYVVNENDSAVQALNAGGAITDSFNYTVTDGSLTDTAVLTVTINGANDAPVGVDDTSTNSGAVAATEKGSILGGPVGSGGSGGTNATGNVLANDTDVDNTNGSLTVTAIRTGGTEGAGAPGSVGVGIAGAHGTLTLNNTGSYTYVVNDDDSTVEGLNAGQTTTDSFNYTVSDGGLTDTAVLTITIKGTNDAAIISGTTIGTVMEAGGVANGTPNTPTASADLHDTDVDNLIDSWMVVVGAASANHFGTYSVTAAGVWTYTLDNTNVAVQALKNGDTLTDSFTVQTADGTPQPISITINGANDAPTSGVVVLTAIAEDSGARTITMAELLGRAADVDTDTSTLTASNLAIASGLGSLNNNGNGIWTYTPASNDNASVSFSFLLSDGIAAGVSASATLDITPVNDSPTGGVTITGTATEDQILTAVNTLADVDGIGTLHYQWLRSGSSILGANQSTYTLGDNDVGKTISVAVSYTDQDGTLETVTSASTAATININDAPTVTGGVTLTAIQVNSGARVITQAELLGNATDPDSTLTASNLAISAGLGSLADNHNGTWTYTPKINDDTAVSFTYQVTDGVAAAVADSAKLDIFSAQSAPQVLSPSNDSVTAVTGNSQFDGGGGVDTITFNFRLVDATVTYSGNHVIIDGPTSHTVLSGFETYVFTDGTADNNDGSPLIDDLFYYSRNLDVWAAHVDADTHYNSTGWREGRDPNAFFSTKFYLSVNQDVKASGVNPLTQFDQTGWKEGRQPSMSFDDAKYLAANPDVAAAKIDPLAHFLQGGAEEGRQPFALTTLVKPNGFDYVYYLQNNPDVLAAGIDPFQHFETTGWKEGRNPNAYFDTKGYLATYTDVAAAGINPLDHYNQSGWKEGRDPSIAFDTTDYLSHYPDVAAAKLNPLVHFLQAGINEGRVAFNDGHWG